MTPKILDGLGPEEEHRLGLSEVTCPNCGSEDVKIVGYQGTDLIVCKSCGYDERDLQSSEDTEEQE